MPNIPAIESSRFGQGGVDYIDATAAEKLGDWFAVYVLAATTFTTLQVDVPFAINGVAATNLAKAIPAGTWLYGRFSKITLAAIGTPAVIAYRAIG
jgi:hypothetical protein